MVFEASWGVLDASWSFWGAASWRRSGASWGHLGASWAFWRRLGSVLGASRGRLGGVPGFIGGVLRRLGGVLQRPGGVLEASGGDLGRLESLLEASWGVLKASWWRPESLFMGEGLQKSKILITFWFCIRKIDTRTMKNSLNSVGKNFVF